MRTVMITDAHRTNHPKQTLSLEMSGGDPWYAYIWINNVMHLITHNDSTGKTAIERHKT